MPHPQSFKLNAIDRFMLVKDRIFRKSIGRGNVCILVLNLSGAIDLPKVKELIENKADYKWISSLRLTGNFLTGYRWQIYSSTNISDTILNDEAELHDYIVQFDINPSQAAPFQVHLINYKNKSSSALLFAWQHALFDAHGAEQFIFQLIEDQSLKPLKVAARPACNIKESLQAISKFQVFFLELAKQAVFFTSKISKNSGQLVYRHIHFTEEETKLIDQQAEALGGALFKSSLYLAIMSQAVNLVFKLDKNFSPKKKLLIITPRDSRRPWDKSIDLGNQINFLYYGLDIKDLGSRKSLIAAILQMAQKLVAEKIHQGSGQFFRLLCYLPDFLYKRILGSPTQGNFASFYLSDIGDSLKKFSSFGEFKIEKALHYPPNFYPPGLSFVCSRDSAVTLTIVATIGTIKMDELDLLETQIRQALLEKH